MAPSGVLRVAKRRVRAAAAHSRRTQRMLVAAEVALAVVLLIGGGVLLRSFARLNSAPLGFDRTHTLTAELFLPDAKYADPGKTRAFFRDAVATGQRIAGRDSGGRGAAASVAGPDGFDYPLSLEGTDAAYAAAASRS